MVRFSAFALLLSAATATTAATTSTTSNTTPSAIANNAVCALIKTVVTVLKQQAPVSAYCSSYVSANAGAKATVTSTSTAFVPPAPLLRLMI